MGKKRKFFLFQNICRSSQPSPDNAHPWHKAIEQQLAGTMDPSPRHGDLQLGLPLRREERGTCREERGTCTLTETRVPLPEQGCVCSRLGSAPAPPQQGLALGPCCARLLGTRGGCAPPQRANASTFLAGEVVLSQETSNTLGPHFCDEGDCDLNFLLDPSPDPCHPPPWDMRRDTRRTPLPPSAKGRWAALPRAPSRTCHCQGCALPVCRGRGLAPASSHNRSQGVPCSCRRCRARGWLCRTGGYQSSARSRQINQRFGLVFGYYGQYIKGIYLRKCLSCQSFPMSSILNTPYNY